MLVQIKEISLLLSSQSVTIDWSPICKAAYLIQYTQMITLESFSFSLFQANGMHEYPKILRYKITIKNIENSAEHPVMI